MLVALTLFGRAQDVYVIFGSYNWDAEKEGIYVYGLDTASGQLTRLSAVKGIHNPSYLTISPDGKHVFACTESKTPNKGSVSSFVFNHSKTLQLINSQSSGGENPVYVSVHKNGRWLVNANYTAGTAAVHPIHENGLIDSAVQQFRFTGSSINTKRQTSSHVHSAVFSPQCDYLYLPDLGADKIWCFQFTGNPNQPFRENGYVKTFPGSGPRHLTFHPNGKYAYCIEEMGGYVAAFRYQNGKLDSMQRIAAHEQALTSGFESADIHISPDGRFLYASNRGKENNIAIFSIQSNGRLQLLGFEPTGGNHPRTFTIDPYGKFIIVTNVVSNTVTVLERNRETGLLKNTGQQIPIPNVSCAQAMRAR